MADEALHRLRRIETRITQCAIALGVPTQAQTPTFADGRVQLPSIHSSLNEVCNAIPEGWTKPAEVYIGSDHVATITRRG